MNKVIIESSIDDTLDSIEYMIEKENKEKDKKEKKKKEKSTDSPEVYARKKLLKRISIVLGIGTAVFVTINTILKAKAIKDTGNKLDSKMGDLDAELVTAKESIKRGMNSLNKMKSDISSGDVDLSKMKDYENRINEIEIGFKTVNDAVNTKSDVQKFKKLNPLTTSRKKIFDKETNLTARINSQASMMKDFSNKAGSIEAELMADKINRDNMNKVKAKMKDATIDIKTIKNDDLKKRTDAENKNRLDKMRKDKLKEMHNRNLDLSGNRSSKSRINTYRRPITRHR